MRDSENNRGDEFDRKYPAMVRSISAGMAAIIVCCLVRGGAGSGGAIRDCLEPARRGFQSRTLAYGGVQPEIGRASRRARVCQYRSLPVSPDTLKTKPVTTF